MTKTSQILKLVEEGMSVRAAAKKLGTHPSLYYAAKKKTPKGARTVTTRTTTSKTAEPTITVTLNLKALEYILGFVK